MSAPCRGRRQPATGAILFLFQHFNSNFDALMRRGSGGEIANSHHRIAAVSQQPADIVLVDPDIKYVPRTLLPPPS